MRNAFDRFPRMLSLTTSRTQDNANDNARSRIDAPLSTACGRPKDQRRRELERSLAYYEDVCNPHMVRVCRQRLAELG